MKKNLFFGFLFITLLLSFSLVSANIFTDFFGKITGKATATCGNGVVESGETCDGSNVGYFTCATFGFKGGSIKCSSSCKIDTSSCTATFTPEPSPVEPSSTESTQNEVSCSDSDGGKNYTVNGTMLYGPSTFSDYCTNSTRLAEYFCPSANSKVIFGHHDCGVGCVDGACVNQSEEAENQPTVTNDGSGENTATQTDATDTGSGETQVVDEQTSQNENSGGEGNIITDVVNPIIDFFTNLFGGGDEEQTLEGFGTSVLDVGNGVEVKVTDYSMVDTSTISSDNERLTSLSNLYQQNPTGQSLRDLTDLSVSRGEKMIALTQTNPEEFISNVLSQEEIDALPESVKDNVETPVSLENVRLNSIHGDDFETGTEVNRFFLQTVDSDGNEKDLWLSSASEISEDLIGKQVDVNGFKIGDNVVGQDIKETQNSNPAISASPTLSFLGIKRVHKVSVTLVRFRDSPQIPFTKEEIKDYLFGGSTQSDPNYGALNKFYKNATDGKIQFYGDVEDWKTLDMSGVTTKGDCAFNLGATMNVPTGYDNGILIFNSPPCWSSLIAGWAGSDSSGRGWMMVDSLFVLPEGISHNVIAHEMGHNLGLNHAHSLDCPDENGLYSPQYTASGGDDCVNQDEYGNPVDIMGRGYSGFSTFIRQSNNWIDPKTIYQINNSGIYTLQQRDYKDSDKKAADIFLKDSTNSYRIEAVYRDVFVNLIKKNSRNNSENFYISSGSFEDKKNKIVMGPITDLTGKNLYADSIDFLVTVGDTPFLVFGYSGYSPIVLEDGVYLKWYATGGSTCVASGDWSGNKNYWGNEKLNSDDRTPRTFTLTCSKNGKSVVKTLIRNDFTPPTLQMGPESKYREVVKFPIICSDNVACAEVGYYKGDTGRCPKNIQPYTTQDGSTITLDLQSTSYICGYGIDVNGNEFFTTTPTKVDVDITPPSVRIEAIQSVGTKYLAQIKCADGGGCPNILYHYKLLGVATTQSEADSKKVQCTDLSGYNEGSGFSTTLGVVACAYAQDNSGNLGFTSSWIGHDSGAGAL